MQIVALYASLMGLLLIFLSYNVAAQRKRHQIGIGDGENRELARAIRVQANFIEYVPMALILFAVYESNQGNSILLHFSGVALVIARLLHAYGLGKTVGTSTGRFVGILLTWILIVLFAMINIYLFVVRLFM